MNQPKPDPDKPGPTQAALVHISDLADYAAALSRIGAHLFSDADANLFSREEEDWPHEAGIRDVRILFEIIHRFTRDVRAIADEAGRRPFVDYPSWRKDLPRAFTAAAFQAERP